MSRLFRALTLVLLAASCGGGSGDAPRSLDNACSILKERPKYARAFKATERRWGVPVHVQMATIHQESKFISDARPPLPICSRCNSHWTAVQRLWLLPST